MLEFLAPHNENYNRAFVIPSDPSKSHTAITPKRRKSTRSTPLLTAVARIIQPRPTIRSASAAEDTTHPVWHEPHLTQTSWELERHKRQRHPKSVEVQLSETIFKALPREVYECIISQLEQVHLGEDEPCPACQLRDLHSLSLVSRAWDKVTISHMYRKVLLFTNEEKTKLPKLKIRGTGRLKLLRRTLREQPMLAQRVRELHLSDLQTLYQMATIEQEDIVSAIASLVMACPNLERLVGFHIPLTHSFDRLSHALSLRPRLKEKLLSESSADLSDEEDDDETSAYYLAACDPTERFIELNSEHPLLSTLLIHQEDRPQDSTAFNFRAIIGTLRQLSKLRKLAICNLPHTSFTNLTLSSLPPKLKSLRLENLPGVNDRGLQRFFSSQLMTTIETLVLLDLEISSLVTISHILSSHSTKLKAFTLAQYRAPGIPSQSSIPDFVCPTLQYMHWELRSDAGPLPSLPLSTSLDVLEEPVLPLKSLEPISCLATYLLAQSIRENAFPSLQRIRVPHDPQGLIQALCRPLATALLPCDIAILHSVIGASKPYSCGVSKDKCGPPRPDARDAAMASPLTSRTDSAVTLCNSYAENELAPIRSRLAAQARILAARKKALMTVRVYDPAGALKTNRVVGGFIGQVNSQITYELRADRGRVAAAIGDTSEQNQWIVNVEDFVHSQYDGDVQLPNSLQGSCGHWMGRRVVLVEELFQGTPYGAE